MSELVSWSTAAAVAKRVAQRYHQVSTREIEDLRADFERIIPSAQKSVAEFSGLHVPNEPVVRVLSREQWLDANLDSYRHLLEVFASKVTAPSLPFMDQVSGVELGVLLGWISARVLGQYDLLLQRSSDRSGEGEIYFVAPNLILLERRFGFQRAQFRTWIALHELTHRAQFEGVPWFRPYFSSLMEEVLDMAKIDFSTLERVFSRLTKSLRAGENPLASAGLAGLLVSEEQLEALSKLSCLMSIAEGHGDWVMDRAGGAALSESWRFSSVLSQRRNSATGLARLLQQLLGLESKLKQYERGEKFISAVEASVPGSSVRLWEAPESIPNLDELTTPGLWLLRLGLKDPISN